MVSRHIKQQLLLELEQLSEDQMLEMLTFLKNLNFKSYRTPISKIRARNPQYDPILQVIGLTDVPQFADDIDDLLYGVHS